MINLTDYIQESIFDIDDNIENMDKRTVDDLLFKPKSTINAFRYIYDIVKDKEVKHEHSLKYNGPYYVSFFEETHDCTMIIIAPYDNHNWQMVAMKASKLYNKIELMDYREETPTRYAFHFRANGRVYFELPKEYNFLFDSIASRCKYKTGNIIRESIFDDEKQMDSLDATVENNKWFKRFIDPKNIGLTIDEASKQIKKDGGKFVRGYRNMDYKTGYIRFDKLEPRRHGDWIHGSHIYINIVLPKDGKWGWDRYKIEFVQDDIRSDYELVTCFKAGYPGDKLDFAYDTQTYDWTISRAYTMPDNWKGIAKLIEDYDFTK